MVMTLAVYHYIVMIDVILVEIIPIGIFCKRDLIDIGGMYDLILYKQPLRISGLFTLSLYTQPSFPVL